MTEEIEPTRRAQAVRQNSAERRPWHAPEFSLLDVAATESGGPTATSDHGGNPMS